MNMKSLFFPVILSMMLLLSACAASTVSVDTSGMVSQPDVSFFTPDVGPDTSVSSPEAETGSPMVVPVPDFHITLPNKDGEVIYIEAFNEEPFDLQVGAIYVITIPEDQVGISHKSTGWTIQYCDQNGNMCSKTGYGGTLQLPDGTCFTFPQDPET